MPNIRIRFAAGLFALLVPAAAQAADKEKAAALGTSVEMPYLIAPLSDGDRLLAYAYIAGKVVGSSPSAAIEIRAKIAFIQDAFVRDVNQSPIGKADDPKAIDTDRLKTRLLADARRVMGAGKVKNFEIIQIQVSPYRQSAGG